MLAAREDVADAASVLTSGEGFEPMLSYSRWHAYVFISSRRSLVYACMFWSLSSLACLDNNVRFALVLWVFFVPYPDPLCVQDLDPLPLPV